MKCSWCKREFKEKELELSHDVPKYIGGTDRDGRHYLCKKHHDIYEKMVFVAMTKGLSVDTKREMRKSAKEFARRKFNGFLR